MGMKNIYKPCFRNSMFSNISQFSNLDDYLPILNAVILTDLIFMILLIFGWIKSVELGKWYEKYNLGAVVADVLIIFIGIILVRFLYPFIFSQFSIWYFVLLAVVIQIIHDICFYLLFSAIPRGSNYMMDTFKDYAKEIGARAIVADSFMMICACLFASFFKSLGKNSNVILLVFLVYMVPYLVYTRFPRS